MAVDVSLVEDDIFTALRSFIIGVVPSGIEVIRAQVNRVPSPKGPNYIVMNSLRRTRLSTNVETWDWANASPDKLSVLVPAQSSIQLDVHGPLGADNAWRISGLFRSSYACDQFAAGSVKGMTPLYMEDPRQLPFITGEQQYEDRWIIETQIQANVTITVPQDFAAALALNLVSIEAGVPTSLDFTNPNNSGLLPGL